jgi:hypothetical protein
MERDLPGTTTQRPVLRSLQNPRRGDIGRSTVGPGPPTGPLRIEATRAPYTGPVPLSDFCTRVKTADEPSKDCKDDWETRHCAWMMPRDGS